MARVLDREDTRSPSQAPARAPLSRRPDARERRAIGRGLRGGTLAADQSDLVGQRRARHRVIVLDELALAPERPRSDTLAVAAEGPREAAVGEYDQEHVLDRRKAAETCRRGRGVRARRRRRRSTGRNRGLRGGLGGRGGRGVGGGSRAGVARSAVRHRDDLVRKGARRRVAQADHDQRRVGQSGNARPTGDRPDDHAEGERGHHRHRGRARPRHLEPESLRPLGDVAQRVGERCAGRQRGSRAPLVYGTDQPRDLNRQRPPPRPAFQAVALVVGQPRVALGTPQRAS